MRRLAALAAVVSMIAAPAAGLATVVAMSASLIAPPAAARADGDPASDVLIGQDVFLPYVHDQPGS